MSLAALMADGGTVYSGQYTPMASGPSAEIGSMASTDEGSEFKSSGSSSSKSKPKSSSGASPGSTDPQLNTSDAAVANNTPGGIDNGGAAGGMFANGGQLHKSIPGPHASHVANFLMAKGGKVPAMVSPGEVYLTPEKVGRVLNGENPLKIGEKFQGNAKVKGNSIKNDTIPKTLDDGGVVISRTHVGSPEKAELFVRRAIHMKKGGK